MSLGWSDRIEVIKQKMKDRDRPTYTDQDGNNVPICVVCQYWRATVGDVCDLCSHDLLSD